MSKFQPEFKGPIEGYVVNFLATNYWRVATSMTHADCVQEAYLVFHRCTRYEVENAKHFMALFKRAWINQFTDLTNNDTKHRAAQLPQDMEEPDRPEPVGETDNAGYLRVLVQQAPHEVKLVLNLFLSAPSELLEMAMQSWRGAGKLDAGGNRHVARMLGLPEDSRPLDAVQSYFGQAT